MSEIADRYRRLSAAFATKIEAVPEDRWGSPSPCEGWTTRDVVRHVVETQALFLGFVGRQDQLGDVPPVDDDPAGAWKAASAAVQADLDDPERAAAEYEGFRGRTRWDEGVDGFLNFDLVVHGWDLARAAGLDDAIATDDARRVLARAESLGDVMRHPSAFGPEVPAPPDADVQARMLAYLGREP
jgi:uncharacterized protein (TIGR03086 family)